MAFVGDGGGGTAPEGSRADATFLGGEATLYAFSDEKVENAQRNIYRADDSGVIYALVFSIPATQLPGFVADTARYWAAVWNANAAIPGVTAIQETQQTDAFGQLSDVAEVAVSSTSGKSSTIATVAQADYPTDRFAEKVAYWRGVLDAGEATH